MRIYENPSKTSENRLPQRAYPSGSPELAEKTIAFESRVSPMLYSYDD